MFLNRILYKKEVESLRQIKFTDVQYRLLVSGIYNEYVGTTNQLLKINIEDRYNKKAPFILKDLINIHNCGDSRFDIFRDKVSIEDRIDMLFKYFDGYRRLIKKYEKVIHNYKKYGDKVKKIKFNDSLKTWLFILFNNPLFELDVYLVKILKLSAEMDLQLSNFYKDRQTRLIYYKRRDNLNESDYIINSYSLSNSNIGNQFSILKLFIPGFSFYEKIITIKEFISANNISFSEFKYNSEYYLLAACDEFINNQELLINLYRSSGDPIKVTKSLQEIYESTGGIPLEHLIEQELVKNDTQEAFFNYTILIKNNSPIKNAISHLSKKYNIKHFQE